MATIETATAEDRRTTSAAAGRRRRDRRRVPVALLVAALVVLAGEVTTRAVASRLDPPLRWQNWETQNKVDRIDALGARGGASVVFVGSSMVNAAIDPDAFGRVAHRDRPAFNAAINGADARLVEPWLLDVVVPRLRPETVVIGVSSRDLNDQASHRQFDLFRTSDAGRWVMHHRALPDRIERAAERWSYLVRYRGDLRRPRRLAGHHDPLREVAHVGSLGQLRALDIYATASYAVTPHFVREARADALHDYSIGGAQLAALRRTVAGLRARGVRVVLLEMPVTADAIALHPRGAADYARFTTRLRGVADATGARLVDLTKTFDSTRLFFDPFHLNGSGRAVFTAAIADRVR